MKQNDNIAFKSKILRFLSQVLRTVALMICLDIWTDGLPLLNTPNMENIEKITVCYCDNGAIAEYCDERNIELAVKLLGYLRYRPFTQAENTLTDDAIEITYYLDNGSTVSVCADESTVLWKGEYHTLRKPEFFIKLATGIFLLNND